MEIAIPDELILSKIYLIRDQKVMLDSDLASLYGVETKHLKRQVRRNIARFPDDFMFELTDDEFDHLRSQNGTSNRGGVRYLPMVFSEQGVAMLSSVLNSDTAIQVNIKIIRIFTKLREMVLTHKDILLKLDQMEAQTWQNSEDIQMIFSALKQLIDPEHPPRRMIGFNVKDE
jgi:hypothetical protein